MITAADRRSTDLLRRDISATIADVLQSTYGDHLLEAVILTGSLARNEATSTTTGGGLRVLGDAEFVVIFADSRRLPSALETEAAERAAESALRRVGIDCRITLCTAHRRYLATLEPAIFSYELRTHGQVIVGDPGILTIIPEFSRAEIPLEDAWRLLGNRMIEQLEVTDELGLGPDQLSSEARYRTAKLYLDMATSLLVFAGAYAPTYRERLVNLQSLAGAHGTPFPLSDFTARVATCTAWKLGNATNHPVDVGFIPQAIQYACRLWRWELGRLTGSTAADDPHTLMEQWMRTQPLRRRLRGWLYVLRRQGWYRCWRTWPRWLRLARQGSPRYCLYEAASQLLSQLPAMLSGEAITRDAGRSLAGLGDRLVLAKLSGRRGCDWRQLAADIVWNYQEFVTGTRA